MQDWRIWITKLFLLGWDHLFQIIAYWRVRTINLYLTINIVIKRNLSIGLHNINVGDFSGSYDVRTVYNNKTTSLFLNLIPARVYIAFNPSSGHWMMVFSWEWYRIKMTILINYHFSFNANLFWWQWEWGSESAVNEGQAAQKLLRVL